MAEQENREEQQLPTVDKPEIEETQQQQFAPQSENPEWWRGDGGAGETT